MTKAEIRQRIWKAIEREAVGRFPFAPGRIPNFVGAEPFIRVPSGEQRAKSAALDTRRVELESRLKAIEASADAAAILGSLAECPSDSDRRVGKSPPSRWTCCTSAP